MKANKIQTQVRTPYFSCVRSQGIIQNSGLYLNSNHEESHTSPCQKSSEDNCAGCSEAEDRNGQRMDQRREQGASCPMCGWQVNQEQRARQLRERGQTWEMAWGGGAWRDTSSTLSFLITPTCLLSTWAASGLGGPLLCGQPLCTLTLRLLLHLRGQPFAEARSAHPRSLKAVALAAGGTWPLPRRVLYLRSPPPGWSRRSGRCSGPTYSCPPPSRPPGRRCARWSWCRTRSCPAAPSCWRSGPHLPARRSSGWWCAGASWSDHSCSTPGRRGRHSSGRSAGQTSASSRPGQEGVRGGGKSWVTSKLLTGPQLSPG